MAPVCSAAMSAGLSAMRRSRRNQSSTVPAICGAAPAVSDEASGAGCKDAPVGCTDMVWCRGAAAPPADIAKSRQAWPEQTRPLANKPS